MKVPQRDIHVLYFKQVVIRPTSIKPKRPDTCYLLMRTVLSVIVGLFDAFLGKQSVYKIYLNITVNYMQIICHDARMSAWLSTYVRFEVLTAVTIKITCLLGCADV
jgi:hypothetical protein